MFKLKWGLPGDFMGGLMIFGIMFTIAVIELYALKGLQASGMGGVMASGIYQGTPNKYQLGQALAKGDPCSKFSGKKRKECEKGGGGSKCQRDSTGRCIGEAVRQ